MVAATGAALISVYCIPLNINLIPPSFHVLVIQSIHVVYLLPLMSICIRDLMTSKGYILVQEVQPAVAALHIRTSSDESVYSDEEEEEEVVEEEEVSFIWQVVELAVVFLVDGAK